MPAFLQAGNTSSHEASREILNIVHWFLTAKKIKNSKVLNLSYVFKKYQIFQLLIFFLLLSLSSTHKFIWILLSRLIPIISPINWMVFNHTNKILVKAKKVKFLCTAVILKSWWYYTIDRKNSRTSYLATLFRWVPYISFEWKLG